MTIKADIDISEMPSSVERLLDDAQVLRWFRPIDKRAGYHLIAGAVAIVAGSLATAYGLVVRLAQAPNDMLRARRMVVGGLETQTSTEGIPWLDAIAVFGGPALIFIGAILFFAAMTARLRREEYLLLRQHDFVEYIGDDVRRIDWDDVAQVRYLENTVTIIMRDGLQQTLSADYFGIEREALAKLMEDVRRKTSFGLSLGDKR